MELHQHIFLETVFCYFWEKIEAKGLRSIIIAAFHYCDLSPPAPSGPDYRRQVQGRFEIWRQRNPEPPSYCGREATERIPLNENLVNLMESEFARVSSSHFTIDRTTKVMTIPQLVEQLLCQVTSHPGKPNNFAASAS